jgi:AraC-like DNA-binding protein
VTAHDDVHTLAAVHALQVAGFLRRWGVSSERVLAPFSLDAGALSDPHARISVATFARVVERARQLSGDPALGYSLGLEIQLSNLGYLGFATMTSATLREAIELVIRFAPTRTNAMRLHLEVAGDEAHLVFEERTTVPTAGDVIALAIVVGAWKIAENLTGRSLVGDVEFNFRRPRYFEGIASAFPGALRFEKPHTGLRFDASYLDLRLRTRDASTLALVREQCERDLEKLSRESGARGRIRDLLDAGSAPTLPEVAKRLHVSATTLKRQLAAQGATFTGVLEEHRRERALVLLDNTDLGVEEIARRVGYSEVSSFTRAFRRWTGTTPSAFRAQK